MSFSSSDVDEIINRTGSLEIALIKAQQAEPDLIDIDRAQR